jgi:hypothetical protein
VGEEVELEALAQGGVVELADPAFPGSTRARISAGLVMSAPTPIELLPAAFAASAALAGSRSTTTACAPLVANNFAVAAPMAPAPPVISATRPVNGFGLLEASLACSSDQYSSGKRSALDSGWNWPMASAPRTASIHISPTSEAILASFSVRP